MTQVDDNWSELCAAAHDNAFAMLTSVSPEKLRQLRDFVDRSVEMGVSIREAETTLRH